jgi:hypothetical protein
MAEGIQIEVTDGLARLEFLDPSKKGNTLRQLLDVAGPGMIEIDSRSGPRRAYIVPESFVQQIGLLHAPKKDEDKPAAKRTTRSTKTKSDTEN